MPLRNLSIANQQVVEILKAMSESPKVIVLDEPTSSLTEVEVKSCLKTSGSSGRRASPLCTFRTT
jgi:ABC-type sugar transport system ATPase subunit